MAKTKTPTGFYNIKKLSLKEQRQFMREAIDMSYTVLVESKYVRSGHRTSEPDVTIKEALERVNDLKVVDRTVQFGHLEPWGEISMTDTDFMHPKHVEFNQGYASGWLFLYCYMRIDKLEELAKKWKLKKE